MYRKEQMSKMTKFGEELSAAVALTNLYSGLSHTAPNPSVFDRVHVPSPLINSLRLHLYQKSATNISRNPIQNSSVLPPPHNKKRNFAQKLFDLLESGYHSDIITWLPGGKAFIVLDKKRFASEILPHYYKESQYTSFTRKLSRWNFTRVPRGPYMGAYYHKNFRSDNRELCMRMSCNNSNGKDVTKKTTKTTQDNEATTALEETTKLSTETSKRIETRSEGALPVPTKEIDSNVLVKATALPNKKKMPSPNHSIHAIKRELMEIRLRKTRLEEKKQLLMMEAEAAHLKDIRRLKDAVNLSIQQAESRIIIAATRALKRSKNAGLNQPSVVLQNGLPSWQSSWQQNTMQSQNSLKLRQLMNAPIRMSQPGTDPNQSVKRAFAA